MLPTRGPGPRGHRGAANPSLPPQARTRRSRAGGGARIAAARIAAALLASTGALALATVTSGAATTAPPVPFGGAPAAGLGRPVTAPVRPSAPATIDLVMPPAAAQSARRAVGAWLKDAGLRPTAVGNALQASSSTAAVGRLLGIGFRHYRLGNGLVVAASSRPRVPASIAPDLTAILGLSTAPLAGANLGLLPGSAHPWTPPAVPALRPSVAPSPTGPTLRPAAVTAPTACAAASQEASLYGGAATLDQVGDHYGVGSLLAAGDGGAGVTIAALELGSSSASDIGAYDACFGLDAARYSVQTVGSGGTPSYAGTAEADVDVEQLQTQAPLADVVSYEGPNGGSGFYDTLSAIVNAPVARRAQVVSISWGDCEAAFGATSIAAFEPLFAQAAQQGQTVLVASGDTGSEGCYPTGGSTALAVGYPASDPSVTAVGGTVVTPGSPDVVWNACATATSSACAASTASETGPGILGASGGGVSASIPEPAFQAPAFQAPAGTFSGRGVPDLSADASSLVTYVGGSWTIAAGTSLSAPLVAGIVADVTPTYATPIGDLAPSLYSYWNRYRYGSALAAVTSGNNDWTDSFNHADYTASATPGYNLATGLGTPIATGLVGPQVTGLSSAATGGGRSLTIDGTNLEDTTVTLGGTPATITAPSSTSLAVTVPHGVDTADVVVSNPIGSAAPAALPTITSADVLTATIGTASSFTVTTSGAADPVLAEAGPLPAGLTFSDNADGTATLAGTPAAGTGGVYPLVLSATTPEGTSTQDVALTVDETPTFTSPATATFSTGGSNTFAPTVTGYPAPTVTESGALPAGVTFKAATGTTPAELTGTPAAGATNPSSITFTAGSASQAFTLDVGSGPAFTSTAGSAIFDPTTGGSYTFSATASSTVTYAETGTLPNGLTLSSAGVLSGTRAAGTAGSYPIVVTARDGQGTTTEQFRVDVPQITSAATATFGTGRPGAFPVVATGLPGATFTESGALPAGVTLASTGLFAGTPSAGTAGTYPVTVTATGDGASLSQALTVQVDVPPAFTSPTAATFTEGQAGTFTVTASGTPAPTLTETGALPSGVTLSPGGFLSGTPAAGTAGTYPVTLAADNPGGLLREPFALTVQAATTTGGGGAPSGGSGAPSGGGGGGGGGAPAGGGGGGASGPTTPPPTTTAPPPTNPAPVPVPITPPPVVAPTRRPVPTATTGPAGPAGRGRVAGVAEGHLDVTIACARAACHGTVTLLVGTTPVSVPRAYAVAPGHRGTFRIALDKAGLARLARARGHVVVVTERVTVAGGATVTRGVRLETAPVARATTGLAGVAEGHLDVTVTCARAACHGMVTLLVGTTPLSVPRAYAVAPGHRGTFRIALDKAGLARLARARGHVVVVTERVTVAGGATVTRVVRLELQSPRTAPTRADLRRPASPGGRTRPGPG